GGHDHGRFDGDQIDADQRHAEPGIDDDAFVQDAVENVDETCAAGGPFNGHQFLLPWLLLDRSARSARVRASSVAPVIREQCDLFFERRELTLEVVGRQRGARSTRREVRVVLPPVETDLLRLVDGADDQADPDRKKFDLGERDFDVTGDGQSLVKHAVEDVDETAGSMLVGLKVTSHANLLLLEILRYRSTAAAKYTQNTENGGSVFREGWVKHLP